METIEQPSFGRASAFLDLFKDNHSVRIPIIQRDYAHGRTSAKDIREGFLNAIYDAMGEVAKNQSHVLNLDFVYGDSQDGVFSLLDGQQRLTTLFLLHWYLAWKEGLLADFRGLLQHDLKCKFTYEIRTSSGEFFDSLIGWDPEVFKADHLRPSKIIIDQSWFFLSWQHDPTVQSCLAVLDAIHERFKDAQTGWYIRLKEKRCITFQLFELKEFGLSEDLYIKMNARGKPLTKFEAFKAQLEDWIGSQEKGKVVYNINKKADATARDYVSDRFDTTWSDLFWHHRNEKTLLFDDNIMELIYTLATNVLAANEAVRTGSGGILKELLDGPEVFSFPKLVEANCLNSFFIEMLVAVLDAWCGSNAGNKINCQLSDTKTYDEKDAFKKAVGGIPYEYEDRLQFHGYCGYIRCHGGNISPQSFTAWMRIVRNLVVNQRIDGPDDFIKAIGSIDHLLGKLDGDIAEIESLHKYLADSKNSVVFFNEQQVREERLKAQLVCKSNDWLNTITALENHRYFRGQIEFLLQFSGILDRWMRDGQSVEWNGDEDDKYRKTLEDNYKKAIAIFDENGLKEELSDRGCFIWERALLSVGDYMLPTRSNFSFLNASDRDASWKRLLRGAMKNDSNSVSFIAKRGYVQTLFEKIDAKDVKGSLERLIDNSLIEAEVEPWRRAIIEQPKIIEYCGKRNIRRSPDGRTYLLKKIKMNGEHGELFTYYLKYGPLLELVKGKKLYPFGDPEYVPVDTDSIEPHVLLQCKSPLLRIKLITLPNSNLEVHYRVCIFGDGIPKEILESIKTEFQPEKLDGGIVVVIPHARIADGVERIAAIVGSYLRASGSPINVSPTET